MDKQTQEYFDSIVTKDPSDLTSEEIGFLRARRSYLDPVQREIFGKVLGLSKDEKPLSKASAENATAPSISVTEYESLGDINIEDVEPGTIIESDEVRVVETTKPKVKKVSKKKK